MSIWLRSDRLALAAGAAMLMGLAAPAQAAECGGEYTVQSGDTLSAIARKCDTSVDALMEANDQLTSPSALSIGWSLRVPGEAEPRQEVAALDRAEPVQLRGWITNGRRCAVLATPDGEEYGVISPNLSFVSGRPVAVQGQMVNDPTCTGAKTLLVTELSTTEL